MKRSLNQALYKYLPCSWADYFDSKTRVSYSTFVKYWNTKELRGVNKKRFIKELSYNIYSFERLGGMVDNKFNLDNLTENNIDIKTLRQEEDKEDIRMEISPRMFFCDRCKSIVRIYDRGDLSNLKCKQKSCKGYLKQASFSYSCECGWTGSIEAIPCDDHKFEDLRYMDKEYKIICNICHKEKEIRKKCPNCGEMLYPKPSNSSEHFFPQSLKYIELLDKAQEDFLLTENDNEIKPTDVIICYWLNIITKEEFQTIMERDDLSFNENIEETEEFQETYNHFLELDMPEQDARRYAIRQLNLEGGEYEILQKIYDYKSRNYENSNENNLELLNQRKSIKILEYLAISNSPFVEAFDNIVKNNCKNEPAKNEKELHNLLEKFGFEDIVFSKEIPLLNFSYGYTRTSPTPSHQDDNKLKLNVFNKNSSNLNVYGNKLKTEGILFTFNRYKVLKWLEKNNITENYNIINEEKELLKWYINNIEINKINVFEEIDNNLKKTKLVYNLLHTISHGIINELSKISGLDKNSLSEHIMPNIPAIFIYCSNEQGINLGTLETTVNNSIDSLLNNVYYNLQECIFDPICINDQANCIGCTIIDEVSCQHFNKDVNRKYVIGYKDEEEEIIGYWDDLDG